MWVQVPDNNYLRVVTSLCLPVITLALSLAVATINLAKIFLANLAKNKVDTFLVLAK